MERSDSVYDGFDHDTGKTAPAINVVDSGTGFYDNFDELNTAGLLPTGGVAVKFDKGLANEDFAGFGGPPVISPIVGGRVVYATKVNGDGEDEDDGPGVVYATNFTGNGHAGPDARPAGRTINIAGLGQPSIDLDAVAAAGPKLLLDGSFRRAVDTDTDGDHPDYQNIEKMGGAFQGLNGSGGIVAQDEYEQMNVVPIMSARYVPYADPDDPTAGAAPPRKFEQPEPPQKIGPDQPDYQNSETVERVRRERHGGGGGIRPAALLPLPGTSTPVVLPDYQNQETMDRVARETLLARVAGGGGDGSPSPSGSMGGVVRLEDGAWYFGGMDRDRCDELVLNGGEGAFVVRDSSSGRGYVLMVNENGETVNYSVGRATGDEVTFAGKTHTSMLMVVAKARKRLFKGLTGGLITLVTIPAGGSIFGVEADALPATPTRRTAARSGGGGGEDAMEPEPMTPLAYHEVTFSNPPPEQSPQIPAPPSAAAAAASAAAAFAAQSALVDPAEPKCSWWMGSAAGQAVSNRLWGGVDGAFCIRVSSKQADQYVLSYCVNRQLKHCHIKKVHGGVRLAKSLNPDVFPGLEALVDFYTTAISQDIACKLVDSSSESPNDATMAHRTGTTRHPPAADTDGGRMIGRTRTLAGVPSDTRPPIGDRRRGTTSAASVHGSGLQGSVTMGSSGPRRSTMTAAGAGSQVKLVPIIEREFRVIPPTKTAPTMFYIILYGTAAGCDQGVLELFDKNGTLWKKYNTSQKLAKHKLRLANCTSMALSKTPVTAIECIKMEFTGKGPNSGTFMVCASSRATLVEWHAAIQRQCPQLQAQDTQFDGYFDPDPTNSGPELLAAGTSLRRGKQYSLNSSFKRAGMASAPPMHQEDDGPEFSDVDGDQDAADYWGNWRINRDQVEVGKKIGDGEYGEVFRGVLKGTGKNAGMAAMVAVKSLKRRDAAEEFLEEARIMVELRHSNLVNFYGVVDKGDPIYLVTELCAEGSLKIFLRKGNVLQVPSLVKMGMEIAMGMEYLEVEGFIHRDLACRNVLLDDMIAKVGDFGLARCVTEGIYQAKPDAICPIRWTAPEAMNRGKYTSKSDVWSFGITVYEMMTKGVDPYDGMSNALVIQLLDRQKRLERPNEIPEEIFTVLLSAWAENPDDRPSFASLVVTFQRFCQLWEDL